MHDEAAQAFLEEFQVKTPPVSPLERALEQEVYQVITLLSPQQEWKLLDRAKHLRATRWHPAFLDALPGNKLLGKGNHDFWWSTLRKLDILMKEENFETIPLILHRKQNSTIKQETLVGKKVLNGKKYGIPQNRERVFAVSIRKDADIKGFIFPETIPADSVPLSINSPENLRTSPLVVLIIIVDSFKNFILSD